MKDKLHSIMLKVRYNMSVVHMVNNLEKHTLTIASKYKIDYDKFIIEDINIISNSIRDSVYKRINKL